MGLRFRKSMNLGPVRFTLSKSGLSTSVGVKGFRVTKTAKGKTRMTASIPGTGISYVKETGAPKAAPVKAAPSIPKPAPVETPPLPPPKTPRPKRQPILLVLLAVVALAVILVACTRAGARKTARLEITPPPVPSEVAERLTPTPETTPAPTPEPTQELPLAAASTETPEPTQKPVPQTGTFVLNSNTKKFHRPSCKSVGKMAEKNKRTVESTREDLIRQGYDPCDICKP